MITWDGAIVTSTDNGATWAGEFAVPFSPAYSADVQQNDGAGQLTLICGSQGSMVASTDGGANWSTSTLFPREELLGVSVYDGNRALTCGTGGTIRYTTDAGASWLTGATGTTVTLWDVEWADALLAYAVGDYGTVLATTDAGANWTDLTSGPRHSYADVTFASPTHGYAVGDKGAYAISTDTGESWAHSKLNPIDDLMAVEFADWANGWIAGQRNGASSVVWATTDGGANWADQTIGAGGVRTLSFPDGLNGYAAGDGGVQRTTDAGVTWTPTASIGSAEGAYFFDATHGFVGSSSDLLETTDAGGSWSAVFGTGLSHPHTVDFPTATHGYAADGWGTIARTTDGGAAWTPYFLPNSAWVSDMHFPTATDGYAVGFSGSVWVSMHATTDGGNSWDDIAATAEVGQWLRGVYFLDSQEGVVVGDGGAILKTTTGGVTAVQLSGLSATVPAGGGSVRLSWSTSFESGHDGFHVYRARQRGAAYERMTANMVRGRSPYEWTDRSVRSGFTYWYEVGAIDVRGHEDRYGPVRVTVPGVDVAEGLRGVRPNPSGGRAEVVFALASRRRVSLTVYNVNGRRVRQLTDEVREPGTNRVEWDGRDESGRVLGAGVFLVRLSGDGLEETEKVVRLR